MLRKNELVRPGFVRISLNYYWGRDKVDFLAEALDWIGTHGWKLLPEYTFFADTGEWRHRSVGLKSPHRRWLGEISYASGTMSYRSRAESQRPAPSFSEVLDEATRTADASLAKLQRPNSAIGSIDHRLALDPMIEAHGLLWCVLPSEVRDLVSSTAFLASSTSYDSTAVTRPGIINLLPKFRRNQQFNDNLDARSDSADTTSGMDFAQFRISTPSTKPNPEPIETKDQEAKCLDPKSAVLKSKEANHLPERLVVQQLRLDSPVVYEPSSIVPPAASLIPTMTCISGSCPAIGLDPASCMDESQNEADEIDIDDLMLNFAESDSEDADSGTESVEQTRNDVRSTDNLISRAGKTARRAECAPNTPGFVACTAGFSSRAQVDRTLWPCVPKVLKKRAGKAIADYGMIRDGDRVLVGLSGGKDSLAMLHVLHDFQQRAPIHFELACVTMNPQFPGFDPSPLIPYCRALGVPYYFETQPLLELARATDPKSICSWCSMKKRGILYACARREKYNVLALAQHLDDLAESMIMNMFHGGNLR